MWGRAHCTHGCSMGRALPLQCCLYRMWVEERAGQRCGGERRLPRLLARLQLPCTFSPAHLQLDLLLQEAPQLTHFRARLGAAGHHTGRLQDSDGGRAAPRPTTPATRPPPSNPHTHIPTPQFPPYDNNIPASPATLIPCPHSGPSPPAPAPTPTPCPPPSPAPTSSTTWSMDLWPPGTFLAPPGPDPGPRVLRSLAAAAPGWMLLPPGWISRGGFAAAAAASARSSGPTPVAAPGARAEGLAPPPPALALPAPLPARAASRCGLASALLALLRPEGRWPRVGGGWLSGLCLAAWRLAACGRGGGRGRGRGCPGRGRGLWRVTVRWDTPATVPGWQPPHLGSLPVPILVG